MGDRRRHLAGAAVCALALIAGPAAYAQDEERGIDPNQGDTLVEVNLANKAAAVRLQLEAETYGVEFNEHYLRKNPDGSVAVTVFGTKRELADLEQAGFDVGVVIEGPGKWQNRVKAREKAIAKEERAEAVVLGKETDPLPDPDAEIVVLRADYFENYAGRFLSVEAKTRAATVDPETGAYTGPVLTLAWDRGAGTPIDQGPRTMNVNIDPDTTPDTYIEHRELLRLPAGTAKPSRIRIGSNTGATMEGKVQTWLGGGLPPKAGGYLSDFTTRYMDPTEVYGRFKQLALEFPNIAELVTLPNKTNGYQRRAQALMEGATPSGNALSNNDAAAPQRARAVVLTSRAWGHEGGNDVSAEFVKAAAPSAPLTVTVTGNHILVTLATNAANEATSTAAQVVAAINANAAASALVKATTYRNNTGTGVVAPRARVNLSDFLAATVNGQVVNAHVPRGPFEYQAMRIGKHRDGSKVGVFLYCQQHAREWATPLTCLETAEQLLRNYAINPATRDFVDNLDIFILPSSNPDGSHYSMYNFNSQRRNLTNHCVEGGKETDDPFAANFWEPRINPNPNPAPGTPLNAPYANNDPGSRTAWGVDLNRNNTFATLFDGYIGASYSCTSDVYAGPGEASEPEIKNELWIADTFDNIKFSNNIHSFGGYFMWAPGAYLPDRSEGAAVHANIGIEKYFFAAGDKILNRIKEIRNTAILPERTGPIADVLYSAAGNSADEHWYNRGVIAYSFETGADRFAPVSITEPAAAGATLIRVSGVGFFEQGDVIVIDYLNGNSETRTVAEVINTQGQPNSTPNIRLTQPLAQAHADNAPAWGEITQVGVGFQPPYATEGKFEALEFAAGNYGLLESAYEYSLDDDAPRARVVRTKMTQAQVRFTFEFVNEPSVITYTLDGSRPTESSTVWDSSGPREPGQILEAKRNTTVRWRAEDIKGNVSYGETRLNDPKAR